MEGWDVLGEKHLQLIVSHCINYYMSFVEVCLCSVSSCSHPTLGGGY